MNMFEIVKKESGKTFPAYPYYLELPVPEDKRDISDIEVKIQTHPTNPDIGIIYRRLEFGYQDAIAYRFVSEWDWIVADEHEVIAEAIRDARRWLALEKGGWKR